MDSEYEKRMETEIDRTLKGLAELPAPRTLMPRVMAALERRAALPWYRMPWPMWPLALRTASMVFLLVSFTGLFVAAWQLTQLEGFGALTREIGGWWSGFMAVFHIVEVLLGAIVLAIKQFGTTFLIASMIAASLGYAMCIGLGTVWVRLAFAKR